MVATQPDRVVSQVANVGAQPSQPSAVLNLNFRAMTAFRLVAVGRAPGCRLATEPDGCAEPLHPATNVKSTAAVATLRMFLRRRPTDVGWLRETGAGLGNAVGMTLPQQLTVVTLGARDLPSLRAFYSRLGWTERDGSDDNFTTYRAGSVVLALYPIERLGAEAAPGEAPPATGWNGVTLAVNVASEAEVDTAHQAAIDAGAMVVGSPERREWGGYSGYVADPEGNRWEVVFAPGFL